MNIIIIRYTQIKNTEIPVSKILLYYLFSFILHTSNHKDITLIFYHALFNSYSNVPTWILCKNKISVNSVFYGIYNLHKYCVPNINEKYDFNKILSHNGFTVYRPRNQHAWSTKCILQRITAFYRYNLVLEIEPVISYYSITGLSDTALWCKTFKRELGYFSPG